MPKVIFFSDSTHPDAMLDAPINLVTPVATIEEDDQAFVSITQDFARRNADGALAARCPLRGADPKDRLWFLRGAGRAGDEIHAGWGNVTLYRVVDLPACSSASHEALEATA